MAMLQKPGKEVSPAERAAIGAETAKLEGRGKAGQAREAVKNVVTGRDDPGRELHKRTSSTELGSSSRSNGSGVLHHDNGSSGILGRTEEELSRLRLRTLITHEGEAFCPNPNIRDMVS